MTTKNNQYEEKPQPIRRIRLKKKKGYISGRAKVDRSKNIYPHKGEATIMAYDIAIENSILHKKVMNYIDNLDLGKTPKDKFFTPATINTPGAYLVNTYLINKDGIYLLKDLLMNDKAITEYTNAMGVMNSIKSNNKLKFRRKNTNA